ncbi:MAG: flippase-like domain-containing protein, partial [Chloroflexi bacterium]|nr:flippase-like domain-containing protein [Chloroflexota bacterium]
AYGDFSRLGAALTSFRWTLVPTILALTLFNYLVRFVKWEYYLRLIGARPSASSRRTGRAAAPGALPARGETVEPRALAGRSASSGRSLSLADSLNIYWAGLFMVITPAKMGEWIKSYFLREALGTPMGRSAPIIIAERLTDGLALALLALLGLASVRQGWAWVLAFLALAAALVLALRYRPLALLLLRLLKRAPLLRGYADFLDQFYASSSALFGLRALLLATALGVVSWMGEGIATYLVYIGLGVEPGWTAFAQSVFILALSTLVGSLVPLPGGLGAVDFSIAGLSQALFGLGRGPAAAASLIVRLCTLWFGVAVGVVSLGLLLRRRKGISSVTGPEPALSLPKGQTEERTDNRVSPP